MPNLMDLSNEIRVHLPPQIDPVEASSVAKALELAVETITITRSLEVIRDADRLVELILGLAQPSPDLIEERSRRLQTINKMFAECEWLTAEELNTLQPSPPANKSLPASDWKRRGRIFGVGHGGKEYFAKYQFSATYEPLDIIKDVLKAFGEVSDPWTIAAWFHFPNGWLADKDGRPQAPKDMLDHGDAVLNAVRQRASYVA